MTARTTPRRAAPSRRAMHPSRVPAVVQLTDAPDAAPERHRPRTALPETDLMRPFLPHGGCGRMLTMGDEDSGDQKLGTPERVWAGTFASLLLGAGAVSVFTDVNEAGSAALILTGGVFGFIAVGGQTLRRIKFGDSEAEFNRRVTRELTERAEHGSPGDSESEVAVTILEQAANESPTAPSRVINTTNAYRYEQLVLAALGRVAPEMQTPARRRESGLDAWVNEDTAVVVKYRGAGRPPSLRTLEGGGAYHPIIARAAQVPGVSKLVIVTNSTIGEDAQESVATVRPDGAGAAPIQVKLVRWTPNMGDDPLAAALSELGGNLGDERRPTAGPESG